MILSLHTRSALCIIRSRTGSRHRNCTSAKATGFEEYVLQLQSDIKLEAERLENGDSTSPLRFQDDRCEQAVICPSRYTSSSPIHLPHGCLACSDNLHQRQRA